MITLSSDFGWPYPAAMKAVILQRTDARLVDVTHSFPRHDTRTAAFWLREILPWFPPAVHLVVVDPGVGTDRKAIAIRAGEHALVGPDNGVLTPAADALNDGQITAYELEVRDTASHTFHGRDVFAPAAAAIHDLGVDRIEDLEGTVRLPEHETIDFPEPTLTEARASGRVLVVDQFGNTVTNIPGHFLRDRAAATARVNDASVPVCRSYATVGPGQPLVTVGSHGYVELAVNQGRGDEWFDVQPDDRIRIDLAPPAP